MKMTKKISDWLVFQEIVKSTMIPTVVNTKLGTVLRKQSKVVHTALEDYREKVEDLRIEHCSVDEKNNILKDKDNQYIFTKEHLRAFGKASKELSNSDLEIEVFLKPELIVSVELPTAILEYYNEFLGIEAPVEEATS
jgi:hypothetical protein